MEYVAREFLPLAQLPTEAGALIRAHLGSTADAAWDALVAEHDDRAAAVLAICNALSRTVLGFGGGTSANALAMVTRIDLLAGDRVYFLLDTAAFEAWRGGGGQFAITRADATVESGHVQFNRGGFGGSLHEGFDIQGFTSNGDVPRIQWNYRHCDGLADIDIDGYAPWNVFQHLSYANSDARQWYAKYVSKFGHPRFTAVRVGGVEPDEVKTSSQCPLPADRLSDEERRRAVARAGAFADVLAATGDFRAAVDAFADRDLLEATLGSPDASPLVGVAAPSVLERASSQQLRDYYLARGSVQLAQVEMSDSARRRTAGRAAEAASDSAIAELTSAVRESANALAIPIETPDELPRARRVLEAEEQATSARRARLMPSDVARESAQPEPVAWLTTDPTRRAGAAGRAIAVQLPTVRLILVPGDPDFRVVSAVPWSSLAVG
jgi:hypothetical protein